MLKSILSPTENALQDIFKHLDDMRKQIKHLEKEASADKIDLDYVAKIEGVKDMSTLKMQHTQYVRNHVIIDPVDSAGPVALSDL